MDRSRDRDKPPKLPPRDTAVYGQPMPKVLLISVADPDPDWFRLQWGPWIRIRSLHPDPGGQKLPTEIEKVNKLLSLEC